MAGAEQLTSMDYLYASNAAKEDGYCQILPDYLDEIDGVVLEASDSNPELVAIQSDLYSHLSEEAKTVWNLFINTPAEVLTPHTGNLTKTSFIGYCKTRLGLDVTRKALKELHEYAKEMSY